MPLDIHIYLGNILCLVRLLVKSAHKYRWALLFIRISSIIDYRLPIVVNKLPIADLCDPLGPMTDYWFWQTNGSLPITFGSITSDRLTGRQEGRQGDTARQTNMQQTRQADRQADRLTDREAVRETGRQIGSQADRWAGTRGRRTGTTGRQTGR
jgi:hypothetical protein